MKMLDSDQSGCRRRRRRWSSSPPTATTSNLRPIGIGKGLKTKINANIGTSGDFSSLDDEARKMQTVLDCGCDAVMDLSTGGDITAIRRALLAQSTIPFGNVPVYEMMVDAPRQGTTFRLPDAPRRCSTTSAARPRTGSTS